MNKKKDNKINQPQEKLKQRLIDIIILIYRYRFLNRNQIQTLLNHKNFSKINIWLSELTEKKYIKRYYSQTFASSPAVYSLGSKGRKYLREHSQEYKIKISLLDRIWYEHNNSNQFRNRCMLLATIYLSLLSLTQKTGATLRLYTEVDLYGMKNLPRKIPEAFFSITEKTGTSKRFFLVMFNPYQIEKDLVRRVSMYFSYYRRGIWQNNNPHPFPEIILLGGENKSKNFLNMIIKRKLVKEPKLSFSLSTWQDIQKYGINKKVLQKVTL